MTIQLDPGEHIIREVRRHPFPFIMEVSFLALFILVPPILFWADHALNIELVWTVTWAEFVFVYSVILLCAWISFFIMWTNYYFDVLVVTDQRLIDIEQKRFFARDMATLRLDKIEDIKIEITGLLPTLLNFGTLHIQTAAEAREFVLKNIPHPQQTKDVIWDLHVAQVDKPQEVKVVS